MTSTASLYAGHAKEVPGPSATTLAQLLPPGRAWTRAVGTALVDLLEAIGAEFDRLEGRAADLLRESVPVDALELLPDWERVTEAGQCTPGASVAARRAAVVARLLGGVPTYAHLTSVIERTGYADPEYQAWAPFVAGGSAAGDALSNDEWQHAVGISVRTRSPADDAALRCVVDDELHVHVIAVWTFVPAGVLLTEDGRLLTTEDGRLIEVE